MAYRELGSMFAGVDMRNLARKNLITVCLFTALAGLNACELVDDQSIMTPEQSKVVNPEPAPRDFAKINERHKILMAVIDTGVDYNHPRILDNIHFELDNDGQPGGLGFDYTANDKWPAPYLARTSDVNPQADEKTASESAQARARSIEISRKFPSLEKYFDPTRNVQQEKDSATHGTHVAGLMVYDSPELGLLVYRVLPVNIVYKNGKMVESDKMKIVFSNIEQSLLRAIASGARVINMSLALVVQKDGGGGPGSRSNEENLTEQRQRMARLKEIVDAHPDVVFVAAAGNENSWVDGVSVLQLPCGINAPNMLCVGALGANNKLTSFSNIILTGGHYLAAPGVDILSLYPTGMCKVVPYFLHSKDGEYPFDTPASKDRFWKAVKRCENENGMQTSTGTSMASPIAARAIAKILVNEPGLSGDDAIRKLIATGEMMKLGTFEYMRIRVEKPSWYPVGPNENQKLLNPASSKKIKSSNRGYFDFFTPSTREI